MSVSFYLGLKCDSWELSRFPACVDGRTPDPEFFPITEYPSIWGVLEELSLRESSSYGGQSTVDTIYLRTHGDKAVHVASGLYKADPLLVEELKKDRSEWSEPKPVYVTSTFEATDFYNTYYSGISIQIPDLVKTVTYDRNFRARETYTYKGVPVNSIEATEAFDEAYATMRRWLLGDLPDSSASWYLPEVLDRRRSLSLGRYHEGKFSRIE